MPVAPAAASSVWAGRGGHWFVNDAAATGGAILSTTFTAGKREYRSMQVRQAWVLQIMVVAAGDVRLKIKKTGSRRRIDFHRGRGRRRRLRGIRQQRVSHKSTCFFSICLLFVPSRPLVSSCSGPVGFSSATTAAASSSSWTAAACLTAFKPSGELVFRAQSAR